MRSTSRARAMASSIDALEVGTLEQRVEIAPVGTERVAHDLRGRRAVRVEDVVPPVGVEDVAMVVMIPPVRGRTVGRAEDVEELGDEIDEHAAR